MNRLVGGLVDMDNSSDMQHVSAAGWDDKLQCSESSQLMFETLCINSCTVRSSCLLPLVVVVCHYIPTNVSMCVHALYGVAAASARVIGYRADCFACERVFLCCFCSSIRGFLFAAPAPPLSHPPSLQILFSYTRTFHRCEVKRARAFTHAPFSRRSFAQADKCASVRTCKSK